MITARIRRHLLRGCDDLRLPSAATENAVQASITSVGYATYTGGGTGATGPIVAGVNSADCVDLANASAANGTHVQLYTCNGVAAAQSWTVASNGTLTIDGGCMDITGANYSDGTKIEWWTCNGGPPAMAGPRRGAGQPGLGQVPGRPRLPRWERSSSSTPAMAAATRNGRCPNLNGR